MFPRLPYDSVQRWASHFRPVKCEHKRPMTLAVHTYREGELVLTFPLTPSLRLEHPHDDTQLWLLWMRQVPQVGG